MDKFYVGALVEAITDHSRGVFKKGDRFEVQAIKKGSCSHQKLLLNLLVCGIPTRCHVCHTANYGEWYSASAFKLVDEDNGFKEVTFSQIKDKVPALSEN